MYWHAPNWTSKEFLLQTETRLPVYSKLWQKAQSTMKEATTDYQYLMHV